MDNEVSKNLELYRTRILQNAYSILSYTITGAENDAKSTAPWTDRTGNARRSINSKTWSEPNKVTSGLGIGVFYGLYLETSNQGKYRIIRPTIDKYSNIMMNNLRSL